MVVIFDLIKSASSCSIIITIPKRKPLPKTATDGKESIPKVEKKQIFSKDTH